MFPAINPTEETVVEAALLSQKVNQLDPSEESLDSAFCTHTLYKLDPDIDEFKIVKHHGGAADNYSVANWCLFVSKDARKAFMVFRGSKTLMDWLSNFSFYPFDHPNYGVGVHMGYYAEVKKEYDMFKHYLRKLRVSEIEKFVVSGHSKGGALAQLLSDLIYNDKAFHNEFPSLCCKMVCVTFSAPMVFWFRKNETQTSVLSSFLFHNYIIRSDPVPLFQAILAANKQSIYRMMGREADKRSLFGQALIEAFGIKEKMNETLPYLDGFKPIGTIYVAHITKIGDPFGVDFVPLTSLSNLDNWEEIQEENFDPIYHGIENHVGVAKNCYQEHLGSLKTPVEEKKENGVYIENVTSEDILVRMNMHQVTFLYFRRVPKRKTVFLDPSPGLYSIAAQKYNEKFDKSQDFLNANFQLADPGWVEFMEAKEHPDRVVRVWTRGQTIVVTKSENRFIASLKVPEKRIPKPAFIRRAYAIGRVLRRIF